MKRMFLYCWGCYSKHSPFRMIRVCPWCTSSNLTIEDSEFL